MSVELILQYEDTLDPVTGRPTYAPADATGNQFRNSDDDVALFIHNTGGQAAEIVFISHPSNFGPYPNKSLIVPANRYAISPTLDGRRFNDSRGMVLVDFITPLAVNLILLAAVTRSHWYKDS